MRPIELFTFEADQIKSTDVGSRCPKARPACGVPDTQHAGAALYRADQVLRLSVPNAARHAYEPEDGGGGQMKTAINSARRRSSIKDIAPYIGRHTVSGQLVMNGVHAYIKDIMGHAVTEMSHHYISPPQPEFIKAINAVPTLGSRSDAPSMSAPLVSAEKLAEGTGKRNDLIRVVA